MPEIAALHETMRALNEALVLGSVRQHELTEAAEALNAKLLEEIAERKRAQAASRDSEARLRDLNADLERKVLEGSRRLGRSNLIDAIESLDHSLVLYDGDDRLVLFNQHLCDQYPHAERYFVVGHTFERIFAELVERGAEAVPANLTPQEFIADRVARHQRADGAIAEVVQRDGRVLHITEHRSKSQGFVSIGRDVTEQLKLAEQLREAQKMDAIGRLTGGLAHDLNNYLAVIIGNLDMLADQPQVDAEMRTLIDGAIAGALRGAELTHSLLAFSRRQPLDPEVVDLGARVADLTRMLKRTIGENIVVDLRVADGLWPVTIDAAQFDTCLVNLANNAHDAMLRGGRLSIALSNVSAGDENTEAYSAPPGDHVLIAFEDDGSGMTAETLAQAFEPFFTTKGRGHGTGLGLSMVHGFVHQSHGAIRVASTPGKGTTVRIYLPRTLEACPGRTTQPTADVLPRGHERILLVEDNEHVRITASGQLKSLGYAVTAVESGDAALVLLERNVSGYDMVLSDILMPGPIDGRALADLVLERWPSVRVLLSSGFSDDRAVEHGPTGNGHAVLRKPYRKADLACTLREILAR